jgi:predicted nuclease with TOPRIM domain
MPKILLIITCLAIVSCGKKGQIEYETAQLKQTLGEQSVILKKLQTESLSLGHLGHYNNPEPAHINQLKDRLKAMREETATLIADRDKKAKEVEIMKKELEAYRSRYF